MARLPLVLCCSHSPFLYTPPEQWNQIRGKRPVRGDVPQDSVETNRAKFDQCMRAFSVLKERIEAVKPDVLVIFGDDQRELFNFDNFPALGMFVGAEFEGYRTVASPYASGGSRGERKTKTAEHWVKLRGHPGLARELLMGLMKKGFDLAFSLDLSNKEEGMGHAFMRPEYYLTPRYDIPVIPIFVNCYFAPQPTAKRCYELGKAVRELIEKSSLDLKVAVLGSGGLWHTPGASDAYLDEEFDGVILDAVKAGDGRRMAEHFDNWKPSNGSGVPVGIDRLTGMVISGIGSGTGETRNWIAAAGVADGVRGTVVDYVPVYASPCGMGFAYWDRV